MKKLNKYSYWILTPALIIGFFLFTGGIMSSSDDFKTAVAPTIHSFTTNPVNVTINQEVLFIADVTANGYGQKYDDCDDEDEEISESSIDLLSNIKIILKGETLISDKFDNTLQESLGWRHSFKYTFLSPGTYRIVATFTTTWEDTLLAMDAPERTSREEMTLVVLDDGMDLTGTYHLSRFEAECSEGPKLVKTSGLGSTLTISKTAMASLNVNVTFSEEEREGRPCIGAGYNFDGSGQVQIVANDNGGQALRIQYNSNVHLEYGYRFDGTNLSLSYNDINGNKFSFRFTK